MKHGKWNTKTYSSYYAMKSRCLNKNASNYYNYGKKGIKICDRWLGQSGFINFLNDLGERPEETTLDRINGDGNYTPENCRWATRKEQQYNRKATKLSNDDVIEIRNSKLQQRKLSKIYNVSEGTISQIKNYTSRV